MKSGFTDQLFCKIWILKFVKRWMPDMWNFNMFALCQDNASKTIHGFIRWVHFGFWISMCFLLCTLTLFGIVRPDGNLCKNLKGLFLIQILSNLSGVFQIVALLFTEPLIPWKGNPSTTTNWNAPNLSFNTNIQFRFQGYIHSISKQSIFNFKMLEIIALSDSLAKLNTGFRSNNFSICVNFY